MTASSTPNNLRVSPLRPEDPAAEARATAYFAELGRKRLEWAERAATATPLAAQALERLLHLAETRRSGQIERIALFIGACWNGLRHFDLYDLRGLDVEISDDMLTVLDGLRWGRVAVGDMVPGGDHRIQAVLTAWGMYGDGQTGQFIAVKG